MSSLNAAVSSLKRSAIDAWMISEDLDRQWQLRGDHYMSLTTDVNLTVTRPSASGYGGGYTSTVSGELSEFTSHYQSAFAEIRSQIEIHRKTPARR